MTQIADIFKPGARVILAPGTGYNEFDPYRFTRTSIALSGIVRVVDGSKVYLTLEDERKVWTSAHALTLAGD